MKTNYHYPACAVVLAAAGIGFVASMKAEETQRLDFPPRSGTYEILPYRVVDGDTVHFYWLIPDTARLHGINAPELADPGGQAAKAFLQDQLAAKAPPTIKAVVKGRGKYGRALLELWAPANNTGRIRPVNLNRAMIQHGHAKEYP